MWGARGRRAGFGLAVTLACVVGAASYWARVDGGKPPATDSLRPVVGERVPDGSELSNVQVPATEREPSASAGRAQPELHTPVKKGAKVELKISAPAPLYPSGHPYWEAFHLKYADLDEKGIAAKRDEVRVQLDELMRAYAKERAEWGDIYPWDEGVARDSDKELVELVGGDDPQLQVGRWSRDLGQHYVVLKRGDYPDVYETRDEWFWLFSACKGEPWHIPREQWQR